MSCVTHIYRINQVMVIWMLIPYHHHLVDTGYLCHTWHIMDVDPLSPSFSWYGLNIHYMSCVIQISRINQVMMIGDQHPLYVMCDTDIPYQPSDDDKGSTHTWHIMDVDPLSPSLGWYGIYVSHMTYNGCLSPITIIWLIRDMNIHYMSCVTQISRINQVMVIGDQHPL
jgi:hypothetical protein